MKERFTNNKWALVLFIATIGIIVSTIVGLIVTYVNMPAWLDEARRVLVEQGVSKEDIDIAINITKGALIFSGVFSIVITIFVSLCGFNCSLTSKWRTGAIIFGAIFVIFDASAIFRNLSQISTVLSNLVSLLLSLLYLIGAVKCEKVISKPSNDSLANVEVNASKSADDEIE